MKIKNIGFWAIAALTASVLFAARSLLADGALFRKSQRGERGASNQ